ncbi:MAG: DUF2735 domain-containing protein [Hyphomicrobium sp.]|jgi:hypothetical protein|nr:DUF2735 domain-containing protein [Hyphomicrobium sp.]
MTESLSRQSAEIIPFPAGRRAAQIAHTRSLEAEAAQYPCAVDTSGWYHDEAIEEDVAPATWRF